MVRILVADDSSLDRQWLAALLAKIPEAEILQAADGEEALRIIAESQPDLVLTDIQMPKTNGVELVKTVRQNFPQIPVIVITGYGSEQLALQALRAGAASYVNKEWIPLRLIPTVKQILEAAHQRALVSRIWEFLRCCRFTFVLENDCQLLRPILAFVHESLECLGMNLTEITRVNVALQEALANAIFHGNLELSSQLREEDEAQFFQLAMERRQQPPYKNRRVFLQGDLCRERIRFVVRDEGPGFDPLRLPNPHQPQALNCTCGRGLLLIHSFMDEVTFNQRGNEIRLVKSLRGGQATSDGLCSNGSG
ncbi:MAG: response regulator [Thermogutta sp.]